MIRSLFILFLATSSLGAEIIQWNPVPEAVGYKVEWRSLGSSNPWQSKTVINSDSLEDQEIATRVIVDHEGPIEARVITINKYLIESDPSLVVKSYEVIIPPPPVDSPLPEIKATSINFSRRDVLWAIGEDGGIYWYDGENWHDLGLIQLQ